MEATVNTVGMGCMVWSFKSILPLSPTQYHAPTRMYLAVAFWPTLERVLAPSRAGIDATASEIPRGT